MTEFKNTTTAPFDPRCACGCEGVYGMGCNLRVGLEGQWWCAACVPESFFGDRTYARPAPSAIPAAKPASTVAIPELPLAPAPTLADARAAVVADALARMRG
jgi:hypothetical protein